MSFDGCDVAVHLFLFFVGALVFGAKNMVFHTKYKNSSKNLLFLFHLGEQMFHLVDCMCHFVDCMCHLVDCMCHLVNRMCHFEKLFL